MCLCCVCLCVLVCIEMWCGCHCCRLWRGQSTPSVIINKNRKSARQCLMLKTDTTLDQDWETVFECTPCTVCHCRQQVWILTLLLSRGLQLWCKTREQKRKDPQTEKARLPTVSCPNNSLHRGVSNQSLVLKRRLLSLSSSRIYELLKLSPTPNLASVSSQNFALHFAIALHLALALLLAIAVMILSSWEVLKLVHRSLVSLS